MHLLTFQSLAGPRLGIKTARGIIDVAAAHSAFKAELDGAAISAKIMSEYALFLRKLKEHIGNLTL